jgi:tricorn protease
MRASFLASALLAFSTAAWPQSHTRGYYRYPAIHDRTVVFTAEGDLWAVAAEGGLARRLTSHPGDETHAAFSPDGNTIAFSADYEGPTEVYTMPAAGGLPTRRTFDGARALVVGWTPDGKILYTTRRYSTLPDMQLASIDAENRVNLVPLSEASQGCYDSGGKTLFFTRLPFQGSSTKRYQGGSVQNLWKYTAGGEAQPLAADHPGTSKDAMWWNGRVYFLSDRDGTVNLWSMDENGKSLRQLTRHQGWDLKDASLGQGRIVYQMGADILLYDIASSAEKTIPIELSSDFDHLREHWVKNPVDYITAAHISSDGKEVAFTSRGRAFVAPAKSGRFVDIPSPHPGRYREARFMPDGRSLLVLSSESGEVELWKLPASGSPGGEQLTSDGKVLRWEGIPSPDGKRIAHQDKDNQLWLLDTASKAQKRIATLAATSDNDPQFESIRWSPDSRWLSYAEEAPNLLSRIVLYNVETGVRTPLTTDRYDSHFAAWSPDGDWIYFISDRSLRSLVRAPWGVRQPEPYFDRPDKIYAVALRKGLRSPFEPADELHPDQPEKKSRDEDADKTATPARVEIDPEGIAARLQEVPVPTGNYSDLAVSSDRMCWLDHNPAEQNKAALQCLRIGNKGDKPETLLTQVQTYEMSGNGKKLLVVRQLPAPPNQPAPPPEFFVVDSSAKGADLSNPRTLAENQLDLKSWTFPVIPADEFREAFVDAWRMHRDYFYDRNMHGVNWHVMRDKYGELIGRVRDREELSDLIAEMVGELSTLHTFVHGGDIRKGPDQVQVGSLGARLVRDSSAGGYRIVHIYRSDPDRPDRASPLARPGLNISDGDVLLAINGRDLSQVADAEETLRNQAGKQVLLRLKSKAGGEPRDVVVQAINMVQDNDLRYHEWEYTRRLAVEEQSQGTIGYVHLRAMGTNDMNQWMEDYIPVFNRDGLIIDVRHNNGGNIDSWILGRLIRKAWMYWQSRVGVPYWNMQQAFRGHMVVLCDQQTSSDGEAFAEGFRRLGLGKVIGMRTWGGEVWLSANNYLVDKGIATTGESGVFAEGQWLIEGRGVEPDIGVDNPPHATFEGRDAQLDAAIQYLRQRIREEPIEAPRAPKYPDKSKPVFSPGVAPIKSLE